MYDLLKKPELNEEEQKTLISFKTRISYDASSNHFNIYIFDDITNLADYTNVVDVFMSAHAGECITVHLNTDGGELSTTMYLRGLLDLTQAECTCVTGDIASAGTMLALGFKNLIILPNTTWMIHNFSGGAVGKGHEIYQHVDYLKRHSRETYVSCYEGFLTPEELQSCIDGNDFYFSSTEVIERLKLKFNTSEGDNEEHL